MRKLILAGVVVALVIGLGLTVPRVLSGSPPEQPIQFDHVVHAQQNGIDCLFCHRTADKETVAGIPAVEQCMFCHIVVGAGNPEVEKVRAAQVNGQPIDWRRVHRVPDHVHFNHEAHLGAGFACSTCHGEVEKMAQVRQVRALNMGDCLGCHRQNSAPTDCATCHY